jgi:amino acid adenylation domain-containing protein
MERLLHDLLTESASLHPGKTALKMKGERLSYRDLDRQSSRLCSFLHDQQVKKGSRIGILLDKSLEAIISIFGILKSGSCYVPLDPSAPRARLNTIIEDCELEWLITSSAKIPLLEDACDQSKPLKKVVLIDTDRDTAVGKTMGLDVFYRDDSVASETLPAPLDSASSPDDLAYILYTSGSTGQPKGVMIDHRAAGAFVDWSLNAFQICPDDVLSAHAPLHFDLSIFDIFTAIAAGATICLVPPGWSTFPRTIADFIEENLITTWYSVPSALVQLVLHGKLEQRRFPALKRVLFAGEVFPVKYLRQLMMLLPEAAFYNLYGPTETNVVTCQHVAEPPDPGADVAIGYPCTGVSVFVVSESGGLATDGQVGELYVSGPTLMSGYWGDTDKTDTVLMENSFDGNGAGLVYRTGDLVHRDSRGCLIFHGRRDMMIKTRGYRVELGEIEMVVSTHDKIKECVATTLPSAEFGHLIRTVIVPEPGADIDEADISRFCSKRLPAYMMPEVIDIVETLPRTSTGKIDRNALSSYDQ